MFPLRQIKTRYEGICRYCRTSIPIGETVFWEQGKGVWHIGCDPSKRQRPATTAPPQFVGRKRLITAVLIAVVAISAVVAASPYLIYLPLMMQRNPLPSAEVSTTSAFNPTSSSLLYSSSTLTSSTSTTSQKPKWITSNANVVSYTQASSYVGQSKTVEGTIVYTYISGTRTVFLDFHYPYQGYFYAVIFSSSVGNFKFQPASFYLNKEVRITGLIQMYQGAPEIIVNTPSQIEVANMGFNYP